MKYLISLVIVSSLLFSSCEKYAHIYPVLEIKVTTLPSQKWTTADVKVENVWFTKKIAQSQFTSRTLDHAQYLVAPYEADLNITQTKLISNDHLNNEVIDFDRISLDGFFYLSKGDSEIKKVTAIYLSDSSKIIDATSFLEGKTYQIEFIIDFDKLVYEEDGVAYLEQDFEIEITEL